MTELPEIKPVMIETRQHEVRCPCCGELQGGKLPTGLESGRQFGPRLEATITSLHHEHHLGYERVVGQVCEEIFGVTLSKDGAVSIVERAGRAAADEAETIGEQVRQSKVIGSVETSARVHGRNWWEWVFVGANREYHLIVPSREQDVIETFMRACEAEVWVCDCWKAQLNAPAKVCQICLLHQIRNLQGLIEKRPRLQWAQDMQTLFRKAIHLGKRRAQLTFDRVPPGFRRSHPNRPTSGNLSAHMRDNALSQAIHNLLGYQAAGDHAVGIPVPRRVCWLLQSTDFHSANADWTV